MKISKNKILSLIIFILFIMSVIPTSLAQTESGKVTIYFFWGDGCPHCAAEKPFLEEMQEKYPELEIKMFETWKSPENAKLFNDVAKAYGTTAQGVPTTFIGDKYWVGYADYMGEEIEAKINSCINNGCVSPANVLEEGKINDGQNTTEEVEVTPYPPQPKDITPEESSVVNLPILGQIDTTNMSMPLFTIILAGLDSFNPCAFFVLFFLLSMLIYAKNRKRMLLIGLTFVFFSALIYFLFMAAWLNLFLLIGELMIITTIAGILALIVAGINIKDFFFFEKGVSLVIPESAKPKLFERMRNLLKATSLPSMMFGTIILAIAANSYELLCTAGFPMVFTRILTLHGISTGQYYLYLALYNLVYIIPLLIIVLMFVITLGAKKLTEWQGQVLKLISGMMMLCLGSILLIKPALLNNIFVSVGLMAAALLTAGIIIFFTKKIKKKKGDDKNGKSA